MFISYILNAKMWQDDGARTSPRTVWPSCSRRCRQNAIKCKSAHKAGRQRARPSPDFEVIFVEVKSGSARLNQNERSLKDAIINKRVRWPEYHTPTPLTHSSDSAQELAL